MQRSLRKNFMKNWVGKDKTETKNVIDKEQLKMF